MIELNPEKPFPENYIDAVGKQFRDRRFVEVQKMLDHLGRPLRIIDLGGSSRYWLQMGIEPSDGLEITLVNYEQKFLKHESFINVTGDATALEYEDNSFDLAFSNSVIEHVGDDEAKWKMAQEVRRVAPNYFIQTPNRNFIVEPHFLLPGIQFMPVDVATKILSKTPLSRGRKWDEQEARDELLSIDLLSKQKLQELFPDAQISAEMIGPFAKSYTAHSFGNLFDS